MRSVSSQPFYLFCIIVAITIPEMPRCEPAFRFVKEHITTSIQALDTIEVQGEYWFANTSDANVNPVVFYPFPVDSVSRYPHVITVKSGDRKKSLVYRTLPKGIEWTMSIPAHGRDSVFVVYAQKVSKGNGHYIVSTTKLWNEPLKTADFKVIVRQPLTLAFWTFEADSLKTQRNTAIYHAHFDNFYPDGEMYLRWK